MRRTFAIAVGLGMLIAVLAVLAVSLTSPDTPPGVPAPPPKVSMGWIFLCVVGASAPAAAVVFWFGLRAILIERYGRGDAVARIQS